MYIILVSCSFTIVLAFCSSPAELFAAYDPTSQDLASTFKPISVTKKQVRIMSSIRVMCCSGLYMFVLLELH